MSVRVGEIRENCKLESPAVQEMFISIMNGEFNFVAEGLMKKKWALLISPKKAFVTSDKPICLWRGTCSNPQYGWGSAGTQITFPICPSKLLVLDAPCLNDGGIHDIDDNFYINEVNEVTILNAKRHVFNFENNVTFGETVKKICERARN